MRAEEMTGSATIGSFALKSTNHKAPSLEYSGKYLAIS
jgi:hypothetical protein